MSVSVHNALTVSPTAICRLNPPRQAHTLVCALASMHVDNPYHNTGHLGIGRNASAIPGRHAHRRCKHIPGPPRGWECGQDITSQPTPHHNLKQNIGIELLLPGAGLGKLGTITLSIPAWRENNRATPVFAKPFEKRYTSAATNRVEELYGVAGANGEKFYFNSIKFHLWKCATGWIAFNQVLPRDLYALTHPFDLVGASDFLLTEIAVFGLFIWLDLFQATTLVPTTVLTSLRQWKIMCPMSRSGNNNNNNNKTLTADMEKYLSRRSFRQSFVEMPKSHDRGSSNRWVQPERSHIEGKQDLGFGTHFSTDIAVIASPLAHTRQLWIVHQGDKRKKEIRNTFDVHTVLIQSDIAMN